MIKKISMSLLFICASSLMKIEADANTVSQYSDDKYSISPNSDNIVQAVEHLNDAIRLAFTIQDKEVQSAVYHQLKPCMECLKQEYFSNNYDKVVQSATILYENLDEIMADCQDTQIKEGIISCVNEMMNALSS